MRILMNEDVLERSGGLELTVLDLAKGLVARGHEVSMLYSEEGSLATEWRAVVRSIRRVGAFHIQRRNVLRSAAGTLAAVAAGVSRRHDVVYLNRYYETLYAAAVARLRRLPLVCHLHWDPPQAWGPQMRLALPHVTRFIAVSRAVRDKFIAVGVEPSAVDVVYNGIDLDHFRDGEARGLRRQLGIPQDAYVVLYAGRLDPEKGVEILLDAFNRLDLPPHEARVVVAGAPRRHATDEDAQAYVAQLRELVRGESAQWLGLRRDMAEVYRMADAVVVPSVSPEGFGRVVVEAMACGRPVVASAVGGVPEILDGSMARFLVRPGDRAELAARLAALRGWQYREPALGQQCRKHVEDRFSIQRMNDGVEQILLEAVMTPARHRRHHVRDLPRLPLLGRGAEGE